MADITMCKDYLCPSREQCARYMDTPDIMQSYYTKQMRVRGEKSCNQMLDWVITNEYELANQTKRLQKDYLFMKQEIDRIGEMTTPTTEKEPADSTNTDPFDLLDCSVPEKPSQPVYYMCYVLGGRNPTYKHETLEQAKAEAERLAKLTSQPVVILKSYLEVMVEVKTRTINY